MHHTKDKGDLAVFKAQAELSQMGFMILKPQSEHSPFDLVIYKDGKFIRIQVKYRSLNSKGALEVPFVTNWADRNGNHIKLWNKEEVDLVCVYCPQTNSCYFFNPKSFDKCVWLRVTPSRNGQKMGINLAENFKQIPTEL